MPSEFWSLTFVEFHRQLDAYAWREENEQWRMASMIAAIYDVNRNPKKQRKTITAEDIMGRKRNPQPKAKTPEEQLELMKQITKMMGGEIKTVA